MITYDSKGRLHHQSLNLAATELVQLLERVLFRVQRVWVAPQIYEEFYPSLTGDLCRSSNFTHSYWLNEHQVQFGSVQIKTKKQVVN